MKSFALQTRQLKIGDDILSPLQQIESSATPAPVPLILELATQTQHMHSQSAQTNKGAFYTPYALARQMAQQCLQNLALKQKLLDPACGSGIFLLALTIQAHSLRPAADKLRKFIAESLYGLDLDDTALDVARRLIALLFRSLTKEALDLDLSKNICRGDFLISPQMLGKAENYPHATDLNLLFPKAQQSGGFNVIIGNPPYGLSRSGRLSGLENAILKRNYADSRRGKVNKYLLFLARAYEYLAPQGTLLFVLPNAWLGIESAREIRRQLLGDGAIDELRLLASSTFPKLGVETLTLHATKGAGNKQIKIVDERSNPIKESLLSVSHCLQRREQEISLNYDESAQAILDHINQRCIPLGSAESPFLPMIALQAYAVGKGKPAQTQEQVNEHCFHSRAALTDEYLPYLHGKDIGRFTISWSGSFLRYGAHLAEPQKLTRFTGPRVLVREILGKPPYLLQACYTDQTFLYNKSVLHILPKPNCTPLFLRIVCAILNSKLATVLITSYGKKAQRSLFPKLLKQDLQNFPIPRLENIATPLMLALDSAVQSALSGDIGAHAQLDSLVMQLYELPCQAPAQTRDLLKEPKID